MRQVRLGKVSTLLLMQRMITIAFHFHFQISGLNSYYLSLLVTNLFAVKYHLSCNYGEKKTEDTKAE